MPDPANQGIFISYAREDAESARRIADALRSCGMEVWFDQNELRGGDTWDQKIRRQIRECVLFIPIISAHTQDRKEGYFRLEWKLAAERTHLMAEGVPFIAPVVVDATTEAGALAPAEFLRVQWMRLPGALPTPDFVEQIRRLLFPVLAPDITIPPMAYRAAPAAAPAPAPKSKLPLALIAGLGVLVLALAGYIALRPAVKESPPTPVAAPTAAKPAEAKPAAPKVLGKSIAVLPLANMSEDKDTGFFADGVHEDLLTNLALVPELKVVSRTSVLQYRGTTKTIRQIGDELGVAYVLEGSVRRAGNKVRVTGQLINTRTDEHVWAESFDRDLTDIFSIQAELSKKIAGALSAAISPETRKFLERKPTENPVAYDYFLRGRDLRNRAPSGARPALREEEALFKSAVQQDPKFAAAWGELAVVHALNIFWGTDTSAERLAQGDAAIANATRLAPDAPDVIRSVGTYVYYVRRDYAAATAQYEKLARLQPNDPTVYSSLALIQRRQGRFAESLASSRRAVELDPANVGYLRNLVATLVRVRRWDEARAAQQRVVELLPGQLRERCMLADLAVTATGSMADVDALLAQLTPAERESPTVIYWRKGWAINRHDYAEFRRLDQVQPFLEDEDSIELSTLVAGSVLLAMGDPAACRARIASAFAEVRAQAAREPDNFRARSFLATFEALNGEKEAAVRHAREAAALIPVARDAMDGPTYQWILAWVYAAVGDRDQTLATLAELLQQPSTLTVAVIRTIPVFDKFRGDPRFEALLNDPKNSSPLF